MKKLLAPLKRMPVWLAIPVILSLVIAIGYVDYRTGDYSILIFYMIPIALAAWSLGNGGAIITAVASGYARFLSDYQSYSNGHVRYFNSLEDTLFLLMAGLLLSALIRLLDRERAKRD